MASANSHARKTKSIPSTPQKNIRALRFFLMPFLDIDPARKSASVCGQAAANAGRYLIGPDKVGRRSRMKTIRCHIRVLQGKVGCHQPAPAAVGSDFREQVIEPPGPHTEIPPQGLR